ncbi:MAG: hypothetical protein HUU19_10905 [Phycisphaerales bacterium]|nr:hypothetical protein [Phycisphaerales bacterium]
MTLARWVRSLTALPLAFLESALIHVLLGWLGWPPPGPNINLVRLGSVFLCGLVIQVIGLFFPPTIAVRSERDSLVFEFRDPTYAEDFEALNGFDPNEPHIE